MCEKKLKKVIDKIIVDSNEKYCKVKSVKITLKLLLLNYYKITIAIFITFFFLQFSRDFQYSAMKINKNIHEFKYIFF